MVVVEWRVGNDYIVAVAGGKVLNALPGNPYPVCPWAGLYIFGCLPTGVFVHFHDVLLPYELHRTWLERGWFWFEQDLLQAFLSGNDAWEVWIACHALTRSEPALVQELVPSWTPGRTFPSAFWIRRCA